MRHELKTLPQHGWYSLLSGKFSFTRAVTFKALDNFNGDAGDFMKWFEAKFLEACERMRSRSNAETK